MGSTLISLIFAFTGAIISYVSYRADHNKQILQIFKCEVKMTMKSEYFNANHSLANNKISESIMYTLRRCSFRNLWFDRSDVELKIQVFFIQDRIKIENEMDVYFEITMPNFYIKNKDLRINTDIPVSKQESSMSNINIDIGNSYMISKLTEIIKDLQDKSSPNSSLFIKVKRA